MNTTKVEKIAKRELLEKGWAYLNDNFHKFKQCNKIKIALTLCVKDMPTELTGDLTHRVFIENIISKAIPNRIAGYVNQN